MDTAGLHPGLCMVVCRDAGAVNMIFMRAMVNIKV
jgi:hypothetical protein